MSYSEFRKINEELNAIIILEKSESIVICKSCTGTGIIDKNFRNKDGSASLIKDQTCSDCRGKGVVAEKEETW